MSEGKKSSDQASLEEANMLLGPGWLAPIAGGLVAGGVGYSVAGVPGIVYAETATGAVTVVILIIKSLLTGEKTEYWVPVEREED